MQLGSSLTNPYLVLFQPRKICPDITDYLGGGVILIENVSKPSILCVGENPVLIGIFHYWHLQYMLEYCDQSRLAIDRSICILTRPVVITGFNRSLLVDWWSIGRLKKLG